MTTTAEARLAEARDNVWLGEVAALEESLTHLRRRRPKVKSLTATTEVWANGADADRMGNSRR